MARRKGNIEHPQAQVELRPKKSRPLPNPVIPTFDRRHMPFVREGKQSAEVFAKNRIKTLAGDAHTDDAQATQAQILKLVGGREAANNATEVVQQERKESPPANAEDLRGQEGKTGVVRGGKQAGPRKVKKGESEQRIPEAKKKLSKKELAKKGKK